MKILVADDDYDSRLILEKLLEADGHSVTAVSDGLGALRSARASLPDLVITDILMPVMDGFTLCRRWKNDPRLRRIPFVFYTATYTDPEDKAFALGLGADRFILKPAEPEGFARQVREVVARCGREGAGGGEDAPKDEVVYLKEYNEVLVRKLEDKLVQLGEANRRLEREMAERSRLQRRTEELNADLERRVEARTGALKRSVESLRRAQRQLVESEKMAALGRLVAGVAHEFNTPIGIGITTISYLDSRTREIERHYEEGDFKRKEFEAYIRCVRESSAATLLSLRKAADLINTFKKVSVERSAEHRQRFDLREYIREIVPGFRPALLGRGQSIEVTGEPGVIMDSYPDVVLQIVKNLVSNAVVHGFSAAEAGTVRIRVGEAGGVAELHFSDDGKGMSEEERKNIFEPFYTTRRGRGGTGLGMHIVYNLVTHMLGGTIECRSAPGEGTAFTLTFPRVTVDH